jgi:hypothetical protein
MTNLPPPIPPHAASRAAARPGRRDAPRDRHMMPVVISTGVFPGVGQMLQGRLLVGSAMTSLFLCALALAVRETIAYFQLFRAADFADGLPPELLRASLFALASVLFVVLVHAVIVADIWREARRRRAADAAPAVPPPSRPVA